jgi:hypothetical protein
MKKRDKLLLSALVVGALGTVAALGVFGAFSATTQNAGNEISTGTVAFSDNDGGTAMFNATGAKPGDTLTKCIRATYTGDLPANVRLYSASSPGALAQYVDLTIAQGTQASSSFPDCTGFSPDSNGTIFSGTLQNFEQTRNDYASGLVTAPPSRPLHDWSSGDSLVYRITATVQSSAPNTLQATSTGVHTYAWEAHNN